MKTYAEGTTVNPQKTQGEIVSLLIQHGAEDYMAGFEGGAAIVVFRLHNRLCRFKLPLPDRADKRFEWVGYDPKSGRGQRKRDAKQAQLAWEQEVRERWRGLLLTIKGKLVSVTAGIREFDQEFMADFVMPSGQTLGELARPRMTDLLNGKLQLPLALPAPERGGDDATVGD